MKKFFLLCVTILLGGCAGMRIETSGDGGGAIGLARIGAAVIEAQKALCTDGVAFERRTIQVNTVPPDKESWMYRVGTRAGFYKPEPRVNMIAEVKCK